MSDQALSPLPRVQLQALICNMQQEERVPQQQAWPVRFTGIQTGTHLCTSCRQCKSEGETTSATALIQNESTCLLLHPLADSELVLLLYIALTLYNGWQQA